VWEHEPVADFLRKEQAMDRETGRLRVWLRSNLKLVAVSAITAAAASAAVAIATVPDSNGVIHTCYLFEASPAGSVPKPGGPNLRVIDPSVAGAGQSCAAGTELPLDFNQAGAPGPVGPPGPAGGGGGQGGAEECERAAVGHVKLSSAVQFDACVIRQVKIGAKSAAVGGPNGPSTEYEVTKLIDGVSQKLFKATNEGTIFSSAKIQVYSPGTTNVVQNLSLSSAAVSTLWLGKGLKKPTETLMIVAVPKKGV
jgi:hypothetical protein